MSARRYRTQERPVVPKGNVACKPCSNSRVSQAVFLGPERDKRRTKFLHSRHGARPIVGADGSLNRLKRLTIRPAQPPKSFGHFDEVLALTPEVPQPPERLVTFLRAPILEEQNCVFKTQLRRNFVVGCL